MKIDSIKKSVIFGFIYAILTFAAYLLYTYIINLILGGESFVYKQETIDAINGLSFDTTQIIGAVLSALIPILLLKYTSSIYYIICIFIAAFIYIFLFFGMLEILALFETFRQSPFNTFDSLFYGIFDFPIGATIGILINAVINSLVNKKH